jgi:hypothetical protein
MKKMKKTLTIFFMFGLLLVSCFAPRTVNNQADKSLAGTEVEFKKIMNQAFAKDYIDADIITYVEFYDANPNKMEYLKIPNGHLAFQVIPLKGTAKPNALGGGEGGYHVFIPKDLGSKVFDFKKGDKLKLRGGTYVTKFGGLGSTQETVNFKATSMTLE